MRFSDPDLIMDVVTTMATADDTRSANRARINRVFEGFPPYTDREAQDNHVETNVNFLEGTALVTAARSQFVTHYMTGDRFFSLDLDWGPGFQRMTWSNILTKEINRILKRDATYVDGMESKFASVVLHGTGLCHWIRDKGWRPTIRGVGDVLIPSRTLRTFENLDHFAVYMPLTLAEISKLTTGPAVDAGWNMPLVQALKLELAKPTSGGQNQTDDQNQERITDSIKTNSGWWASDAAPFIRCWDFYFLDTDMKSPVWKRKIVLDPAGENVANVAAKIKKEPLYDGRNQSFGEDTSQVLHCLHGDGSVTSPFRYHGIRSLGWLTYAAVSLLNRLRCKFNDAVLESMLWYFRVSSESDHERISTVQLQHLGLVPEGLSWVRPEERHEVDNELVGAAMAMNRQLITEHAASFTRDLSRDKGDGSGPEMTATEAVARVNASNALSSSMLARSKIFHEAEYREEVRRFWYLEHPDCKEFRERCIQKGVPKEVFAKDRHKDLNVRAETSLGGGSQALQAMKANKLMEWRPAFPPESQRKILHIATEAVTNDATLAEELVPMKPEGPSSAQEKASFAWSTLMDAKPVAVVGDVNPQEYIETLLDYLDSEIERINQAGGTPDGEKIQGLMTVVQHVEPRIALISRDKAQVDRARIYDDSLGNAANQIKGFIQRHQEAQQSQQGSGEMDAEEKAKIQALFVTAQSKAKIANANASQKREHKEVAFIQDQTRKDQASAADLQRKQADHSMSLSAQAAKLRAGVAAQDLTAQAQVIRDNEAAAAEAARQTTPASE